MMTEAPNEGRIGTGILDEIPFAHKIGTFANITKGDCGIIYPDNRNYAMCMMINLPSSEANKHFSMVSSLIYLYLSSQK
ncbi:MAG: hypothetical protein JWP13_954 [Candidatus Saccharibacteria bacterium]|nr:hypothetical protein [Candidatus Saccharibacteria bacterium]